jgi:hypothetical protein
MSEHQETVEQVVKRIEASFVKIQTHGDKVDQYRISAGKMLVELKARIEGGGTKWWPWYRDTFKNRTQRDAMRVMALANADDPETAAAAAREKNRKAVEKHRKQADGQDEQWKETTYSKSPSPDLAPDEEAIEWATARVFELANAVRGRPERTVALRMLISLLTEELNKDQTTEESADARKELYSKSEDDVTTPKRPVRKVRPDPTAAPAPAPESIEGHGGDTDDGSITESLRRSPPPAEGSAA